MNAEQRKELIEKAAKAAHDAEFPGCSFEGSASDFKASYLKGIEAALIAAGMIDPEPKRDEWDEWADRFLRNRDNTVEIDVHDGNIRYWCVGDTTTKAASLFVEQVRPALAAALRAASKRGRDEGFEAARSKAAAMARAKCGGSESAYLPLYEMREVGNEIAKLADTEGGDK